MNTENRRDLLSSKLSLGGGVDMIVAYELMRQKLDTLLLPEISSLPVWK